MMEFLPEIKIVLLFGLLFPQFISTSSDPSPADNLIQHPDEIADVESRLLVEKRQYTSKEPPYRCPEGWILNSDYNKCFRVFSTVLTWAESLTFCRDFGGDLASLHSETDFVLAKSLTSEDTWIGLNDIEEEGVFVWSDSSVVDFTSWGSGEPNNSNGNQNCVKLRYITDLAFDDDICTAERWFLCQQIAYEVLEYRCPEGWILNSALNTCLRSFNTNQSWAESLTFCRDFGGDLASLHSETDFILAKSLVSEDTWIGLNDISTDGRMEWSDSSAVDYTSWAPGEPNNVDGTENCVELDKNLNFDFTEDFCTAKNRFLCGKIPDEVVPEYRCPGGWIRSSNSSKCFRLINATQTWPESVNFCRDFGGDLASLHSETDFVLAKSLVYEDTWIGLNDIEEEGVMVWSDSSAVDFTSWAFGEPNDLNGTENCVDLSEYDNFDFTVDVCSKEKRFLCEIKIVSEEAAYTCPEGWILNSDSSKCLRVINNNQSWPESLTFCRDFGGDLASLHSETDFVLAKSLVDEDTWIGLNDIEIEGAFVWSDSSAVDFTSWYPGEPNNLNGAENCVELHVNFDFNDYPCDAKKRFICEIFTEEKQE